MNEFELPTFAFVQHNFCSHSSEAKTHGDMRVILMVLFTPQQWLGDTDPDLFFFFFFKKGNDVWIFLSNFLDCRLSTDDKGYSKTQ